MSTNRKVKEQNEKPSFGLLLGTGIAFVLIGSFLLIARMANLEVRLYSYRYLVWSFIGGFLLFFFHCQGTKKNNHVFWNFSYFDGNALLCH